MNIDAFRSWLEETEPGKAPKLYSDCASRANRVEKAFQAIKSNFSFDAEYQKDKGEHFMKLISRRGISIEEKIALPIGTNQMDSISSAVKKYFKFLATQDRR